MVSREASHCSSESRRITKGPFCAALSPSLEVMGANRAMCDVPPDLFLLFFIFLLQIAAGGCLQVQSKKICVQNSSGNLVSEIMR